MPPSVSIGLPVYNGQDFIAESVESLLSQTIGDFELIISDNASTDLTQDICRQFASRDRRVRYIRQPANKGASWNFNYTFSRSRGRYFRWHAHDDISAPRFLEECVKVLDNDPSVVLVWPREVGIDSQGRVLGSRPFQL